MLSDDRLRSSLRQDPQPPDLARNPQTGRIDEQRLRRIEALASHERRLLRLPSVCFTPWILQLVLGEVVAIFGLLLSLISHTFPPILPFAAAAFVLNLMAFPRIEPLLDRASRLAP